MARIAFVLADDFEDSEFREPHDALYAAGHELEVIGAKPGVVRGKHGTEVKVEAAASERDPARYDALVIPGGYSPDHLRVDLGAVRFTRAMALANKPVAAVCHAPWMLIEADLVDDRMVTSWPSLRTDLLNAGARWVDRAVVIDGNIITSRKPDDLPAFSDAILHQLAEGVPERATPAHAPESAPGQPPTLH